MKTDRKKVKSPTFKVWWCMALCIILLNFNFQALKAQSTEVQQLLLNVEKLSQLKNILSDMKRGYVILSGGYNTVRNIAQRNFSLHELFLDGLMAVSPEVRKYHKVVGIVNVQSDMISEYKSAYRRFAGSGVFSAEDLGYLAQVYGKLSSESLQNLDRLLMVVTTGKMRMSDEERLSAIDRIYEDTVDKLGFLRSFNQQATLLGMQRQREKTEVQSLSDYFKNP
ncbi:TerB family tellurite resistance protein [Nubsella zeaxanthinifaciens]|uniref:TerB family tellurite resistance protein n=1 Tax=Nubsella zeaxanthinifaciens TaxID=392412 RepID=UPI003CFC71C5